MPLFKHTQLSNLTLRSLIRKQMICFGGHRKLQIYGTLHCAYGKRMKADNRVFFSSEKEAQLHGYRPCGHCLKSAYQKWKNELVQH
jgi:methylphosphotriester-DNA--protein-cysteine methyltransferase